MTFYDICIKFALYLRNITPNCLVDNKLIEITFSGECPVGSIPTESIYYVNKLN